MRTGAVEKLGIALLTFLITGSLFMAMAASAAPPQVETPGTSCPSFDPEAPELCGVISLPGGGDVSYYFELGTTSDYDEQIPVQPAEVTISADEPSITVEAPLSSGLSPGTIYHYRLAVSDGQATRHSADATFATPATPSPPQVETPGSSCAPFDPGRPELCSVISLPGGGDVSYHFELGTTSTYDQQTQAVEISIPADDSSITVKAPLSGLLPGTLYHYRLAVSDDEGTHHGPDAIFTMPDSGGAVVPEPPVGVPAPGLMPVSLPSLAAVAPGSDAVALQQALQRPKAQPLKSVLKRCQKRPKQRQAACKKRLRHIYLATRGVDEEG